MKTRKVNTGAHEMQEPHEAADCRINEAPHNHPSTDCGHYVDAGPGATGMPDLNMYEDANGKHAIVADGPRHNLDQDPTHGPGVDGCDHE